jgi:hypothetical protein
MDNDWDQYVGDLDLEYNEKFEVLADNTESPSLSAIQVPTPPVSIAWTFPFFC